MKSFHTRLWMKWEPGDTIFPRARSLPAELLIFPSGAEMIFCPSFFSSIFFFLQRISAGQFSPSVFSFFFFFFFKGGRAESSKLESRWDEHRSHGITLAPDRLCHVSARKTSEREVNIFMSWRWPYEGLRESYCNTKTTGAWALGSSGAETNPAMWSETTSTRWQTTSCFHCTHSNNTTTRELHTKGPRGGLIKTHSLWPYLHKCDLV